MTETREAIYPAKIFTDQRKSYFSALSTRTFSAFKYHVNEGLWVADEEGRDWKNVSEHCLVEIARVDVLANMVGLSGSIKKSLEVAAGLHDAHKKKQKAFVEMHGLTFASFELAAKESQGELTNTGLFEINVVGIAGAVGHESLDEIIPILAKTELSQLDKAMLIMHYVDDYTIEANWAKPTERGDGINKNDLDRRMDKNASHKRYKKLNKEGESYFNGEKTYDAQRRIGHLVETRLAQLIQEATGEELDPLDLPTLIDAEIKNRMANL